MLKRPGLKNCFHNLLLLRFELTKILDNSIDEEDHENTLIIFNKLPGPSKSNIKRRVIVTIFIYHIIRNYRGWRYIRNLPIHGQRTWSNAWTAHRCNTLMKKLILKRGRSYYGNLQTSEIYTAYLAEYVNKKWKEIWYHDWRYARDVRISTKKRRRRQAKIDLYSMAKGHIITKKRLSMLTKKQRAQHNLNNFSLGFTPGFTLRLLRRLFKMRELTTRRFVRSSKLILNKGDMRVKGAKKKKKKINEKARLAAHVARKKAKEKKKKNR